MMNNQNNQNKNNNNTITIIPPILNENQRNKYIHVPGPSNNVKEKSGKKKKKKKKKSMNNTNNTNISPEFLLNIGTLNVRTLNDLKFQNIVDLINKQNLDVLGLTETNVTSRQLKFMALNKLPNHEIFGESNNTTRGTGVALIVNKNISKYISKIEFALGRIIKINFIFAKDKKLSIVNVYNKSGNHRAKQIQKEQNDINLEIIKFIKQDKKDSQIIVMGDFNIKYAHYKRRKINGK